MTISSNSLSSSTQSTQDEQAHLEATTSCSTSSYRWKLVVYFATIVVLLTGVYAVNFWGGVRAPSFAAMNTLVQQQMPNDVLISTNTLHQRGWVRAKILNAKEEDVLILGSSTVGHFSSSILNRPILNAWLGGMSIQDLESIDFILTQSHWRPKFIVVGVDLWWAANPAWSNDGWQAFIQEYILARSAQGHFTYHEPIRAQMASLKELLSYEKTTDTIRALRRRGFRADELARSEIQILRNVGDYVCALPTLTNAYYIRSFDGSSITCDNWLKRPEQIRSIALSYLESSQHQHKISEWHEEIEWKRLHRIETIVKRWTSQSIKVFLLAMPYHPLTYATLTNNTEIGKNIALVDDELLHIATRTKASFLNLRDPAKAECEEFEFEDSHHSRPSCVAHIAKHIQQN